MFGLKSVCIYGGNKIKRRLTCLPPCQRGQKSGSLWSRAIWNLNKTLAARCYIDCLNIHVNCSCIWSLSEACWVQQPSKEKDGVQKWPLNSWNVSQNKPLNPNLPTSVTLHWVKRRKHCQGTTDPTRGLRSFTKVTVFSNLKIFTKLQSQNRDQTPF